MDKEKIQQCSINSGYTTKLLYEIDAENIAKLIGQFAGKAVRGVTDKAEDINKGVESAANKVQDIGSKVSKTIDLKGVGLQKGLDAVESKATSVGKKVADTTDSIGSKVSKAIDLNGVGLQKVLNSAKSVAHRTADTLDIKGKHFNKVIKAVGQGYLDPNDVAGAAKEQRLAQNTKSLVASMKGTDLEKTSTPKLSSPEHPTKSINQAEAEKLGSKVASAGDKNLANAAKAPTTMQLAAKNLNTAAGGAATDTNKPKINVANAGDKNLANAAKAPTTMQVAAKGVNTTEPTPTPKPTGPTITAEAKRLASRVATAGDKNLANAAKAPTTMQLAAKNLNTNEPTPAAPAPDTNKPKINVANAAKLAAGGAATGAGVLGAAYGVKKLKKK